MCVLVSNLHLMASTKEGIQPIGGLPAVRRRVSSRRFVSFYLLVLVACLATVYGTSRYLRSSSHSEAADLAGQDPELVWSTVSTCLVCDIAFRTYLRKVPPTPVDKLVWISCYKGLQCAKMTVKRSSVHVPRV